jgi:hypothetical protein
LVGEATTGGRVVRLFCDSPPVGHTWLPFIAEFSDVKLQIYATCNNKVRFLRENAQTHPFGTSDLSLQLYGFEVQCAVGRLQLERKTTSSRYYR